MPNDTPRPATTIYNRMDNEWAIALAEGTAK